MGLSGKSHKELIELVAKFIPPLSPHFHKGQAGRIAVVGGCEDYTGAPYFSAIAATTLGCDMSHVICEKNAGTIIKTYSPNLMVHPYLYDSAEKSPNKSRAMSKVESLLDRIHVLVVGPGLGRDDVLLDLVKSIISRAKSKKLPIVIDADGLFLVQNSLDLITNSKDIVLTPNVVEFSRLSAAAGLAKDASAHSLAKKLNGPIILQKGETDIMSDGSETLRNEIQGGAKRVSGQGDTLSGCLGTFLAWRQAYLNGLWEHDGSLAPEDLIMLATYGASTIARTASKLAFAAKGRATLTTDVSDHVGAAYDELFK